MFLSHREKSYFLYIYIIIIIILFFLLCKTIKHKHVTVHSKSLNCLMSRPCYSGFTNQLTLLRILCSQAVISVEGSSTCISSVVAATLGYLLFLLADHSQLSFPWSNETLVFYFWFYFTFYNSFIALKDHFNYVSCSFCFLYALVHH